MANNQFSLGDAIDAYLKEIGMRDRVRVERVISEWGKIMGPAIAENTERVWFREGVFFVQMKSPIWKSELGMAKSKIKEVLNREMGAEVVTEVKVV